MYPIIIRESRYSGAYEGGRWFAYHADIPLTLGYYEYLEGDDCDAVDFWSSDAAKLIGVGDTPNEALADMQLKNPSTRTSLD